MPFPANGMTNMKKYIELEGQIYCSSCVEIMNKTSKYKGVFTLFESNRIQLRKFSEDDILTYYKWHNDIDVMSSTTLTLDKYSFQDTEKLCQQFIHSSNSKSYIIEEKLRIFQLVLLL